MPHKIQQEIAHVKAHRRFQRGLLLEKLLRLRGALSPVHAFQEFPGIHAYTRVRAPLQHLIAF